MTPTSSAAPPYPLSHACLKASYGVSCSLVYVKAIKLDAHVRMAQIGALINCQKHYALPHDQKK